MKTGNWKGIPITYGSITRIDKIKEIKNLETTITFWANTEERKDPPYDVEIDINGGLYTVISSTDVDKVIKLFKEIENCKI